MQIDDQTEQEGQAAPPARLVQQMHLRPLWSRPRWRRWIVALVAVAAVIALGFWAWGRLRPPALHGTVLQATMRPVDFALTSGSGETVRLSDLQGKWATLYFGYTFCPDVCPTTLADLKGMTTALGRRANDVQVVFISLDPERDTPERLSTYLAYFNPAFIGLTGDPQAIDAAATQFGVYYERREAAGASGYLIDHTSTVLLLDPEGYVRMVFPYGVTGEDMAADLLYFMRRG